MNQRVMDELVVRSQVRMAERLAKWQQKWLGERAYYGDQLGSDVQSGFELPAAGEETEEMEIYGEEGRQPVENSQELGGIPV